MGSNKEEGGTGCIGDERFMGGIFMFADRTDVALMLLGTLGAIGDGCSINCLLLFFVSLSNSLGSTNSQEDGVNSMRVVNKDCLYFVYIGLAVMMVAFIEGYCWSATSERQILRIRRNYLEAIVRQEVGFFDSQEATTSVVINSISKDLSLMQEVLSEKVPTFLMNTSVFMSGLVLFTYFTWRLSLAMFPLIVLIVIPYLLSGKYLVYISLKSHNEYAKANAIVSQALSAVKTVFSFTAENWIIDKYTAAMDRIVDIGIKQGIAKGLVAGSTGLSFAIWAFLAWYGSRLVMYHGENGGTIYAAGLSFVMGGMCLGMALPLVKDFTEASVAATRILKMINRTPLIEDNGKEGQILENFRGMLEFNHVYFAYPSRPDSLVLKDFNLKVPEGKTVALVGSSGSGKSTVITLSQRFYDVNGGVVQIDGIDLRKLQLKWIRRRMGLVSQDNALFGISIKENIMLGKPDASTEEMIAAAMRANAHDFICQLPEGYETKVGERGGFLSGGQKQRIAIARAIIKNPAILLLDEATSALDAESEKLICCALQQASTRRTTLVVAHKLSTVKNADQIAVIESGNVVEFGTHEYLMNNNGFYSQLANLQHLSSVLDEEQLPNFQHQLLPTTAINNPTHSSNKSKPPSDTLPDQTSPRHVICPEPFLFRLLSMNSPEWKQALSGSISAIVFGSIQPIYGFVIGGMISAFYLKNHEKMQAFIQNYAMALTSLSIIYILMNVSMHYHFAYMGEHLTRRIRLSILHKILKFEAAWFDEDENSSGVLCAQLSLQASLVKTLVADRLSLLVQTASMVLIAMLTGLVIAWKLALVMIIVQPLTIICYYAKMIVLARVSKELVRAQANSSQIAMEAVYNHRIITSFDCTEKILELFDEAQEEPRKAGRTKSWAVGLTLGCSPCLTFTSWALDYWYGGKLVQSGQIAAEDIFKTFFILISTGKMIAEAGSMASDISNGAIAVVSLFKVLDRQLPMSKHHNEDGKEEKIIQGMIEMEGIEFAYPRRPQHQVLQDFYLDVKAGSSIGLVGRSGCGKSTVVNLIQRFYDVKKGVIKIDHTDIREMDVVWYRGFTALVSQEPVIFLGSIHDNIAFGNPEATEDEILHAARAANAHDFISSLKEGYLTNCGERGVQLSGGQKQRISIARAVLRNPRILLLDEATSALDAQSESAVQEALERIMVGRTTVVVAHRLSTVKDLDAIAFVGEGRVVEKGSYKELMSNRGGAFFNLATLQS